MFHQFLPILPLTVVGALFFKRRTLAYGFPLVLLLVKCLLTKFSPLFFFTGLGLLVAVFCIRKLKEVWGQSLWALTGYAAISLVSYEILSNFGVWMIGGCVPHEPPLYAHTAKGFLQCYQAAGPYVAYHFLRDIPLTVVLGEGLVWLGKLPVAEKIAAKIGLAKIKV